MLAMLLQFNATQWGILIIHDVDHKVYAEVDIFQSWIIIIIFFCRCISLFPECWVCFTSNLSLLKVLQHKRGLFQIISFKENFIFITHLLIYSWFLALPVLPCVCLKNKKKSLGEDSTLTCSTTCKPKKPQKRGHTRQGKQQQARFVWW